MQGTLNLHAGHGRTRNGRQQGTTQRVSEGVAEAGLQRLNDEPGTSGINVFLAKDGTLGNEH